MGKYKVYNESLYNDMIFPPTDLIQENDCIKKVGNEQIGGEDKIEIDGIKGSCGKREYKHTYKELQEKKHRGVHPSYNNEYMVFDEKRINIKAIVKIKMICPKRSSKFKCLCSYQSPRKRQSQEMVVDKDENQDQNINEAQEQSQHKNLPNKKLKF